MAKLCKREVFNFVKYRILKIIVIASLAESLINFRGELLSALIQSGYEVIAFAPGKNFIVENKLKNMGIKLYRIPLQNSSKNPLKDIFTLGYMIWLIRRQRADIIFNYTVKPVIYGSIAGRIAGVSNIFSMITGLGYSFIGRGFKGNLLQFVVCVLYRFALKKNKNVFFQNPDDLELFVDRKLVRCEQAVLIAGSGINLNQFTVTKIFTKPTIFLLIARLLKDKGIFEYVEAARYIKVKYPKAVFQLLGPFDNNPAAISKSKIIEWDDEGVIDYLGETKDVRPFISKSNIFVLPSYREGAPRSTLEAMAMGRPVITTDVPGCRETVINGQNGFLVPSKNIESLVKAMEYFLINFESIPQMGKYSRKLAELKFDVHKVNMIIIRAIKTSNC